MMTWGSGITAEKNIFKRVEKSVYNTAGRANDTLFSNLCPELISEHPLKVMSKQNVRQRRKPVFCFRIKKSLIPFH
jgi:hypothetical protein